MGKADGQLTKALKQLTAEREEVDRQIAAVERALRALGGAPAGGSYDVRTVRGRNEFDSAVTSAMRSLGGDAIRAAEIRKVVGGTPAHVRASLNRLIEAGEVTYEGQARGTRYTLS